MQSALAAAGKGAFYKTKLQSGALNSVFQPKFNGFVKTGHLRNLPTNVSLLLIGEAICWTSLAGQEYCRFVTFNTFSIQSPFDIKTTKTCFYQL